MFENITKSFQESVAGWKMFFGGVMQNSAKFGGVSETEIGTALIGPGFSAAQQRFVGVKAGAVSQISAEAQAPVGVRYRPATPAPSPPLGEGARVGVQNIENETSASLIERIQKSIGESAEGWRMGFASVTGKAKEAAAGAQASIQRSLAGWQMGISEAGGKVSETFGNVGDWFKATKWQMLLPVIILGFIAVMVAIGYSGVGGPAARVAEREYVKRR